MTQSEPASIRLFTADNTKKLMLCLLYICISSALIRFNKFLMTEGRFPFSMALTAIHMSVSSFLCLLFYCVAPSRFPGMENVGGRWTVLIRWFVPIGLSFAITLYTANAAYKYCSVSFLQFMKEGNVIMAFLLSCAVGLQVLSRVRLAVVAWVVAGSALAVTGEMHFVLVGFTLQLVSGLAECCRAVMGEAVLRGAGLKLDPLSYTMFVAPTSLVVLLIGNYFMWAPEIPQQAALWWHYLAPNALLAFMLNVVVASVIKEVSAVGFMLAGLVKDVLIVLFSCAFFGEAIAPEQAVGFSMALMGVCLWSYLKAAPDSPVAACADRLLGAARAEHKAPSESTPLVSTKA